MAQRLLWLRLGVCQKNEITVRITALPDPLIIPAGYGKFSGNCRCDIPGIGLRSRLAPRGYQPYELHSSQPKGLPPVVPCLLLRLITETFGRSQVDCGVLFLLIVASCLAFDPIHRNVGVVGNIHLVGTFKYIPPRRKRCTEYQYIGSPV